MTHYTSQTADFSTGAAFDYRGLARLRRGVSGAQANDADQREVAHQFEALFLQMMLQRMRAATPRDGLFDSDQTRMVQSLADEQLSTQLAKPGIGLAHALLEQIQTHRERLTPTDTSATPAVAATRVTRPVPVTASKPETDAIAGRAQRFVAKMATAARHAAARVGMPAPLVLAQAALESGWGAREIRHADGRASHNLFGIKASAGWQGEVVKVMTTEYKDGVAHLVEQAFRAYRSYAESFEDYARLIAEHPRYRSVREASNATEAARALQSAGYASDPAYADKLINVMSSLPGEPGEVNDFIPRSG